MIAGASKLYWSRDVGKQDVGKVETVQYFRAQLCIPFHFYGISDIWKYRG